ncbi:MAG: acyl-ACP--UDP-N-acetylglucosamine O-acyltransferase [Acidobacteriota bacterium]
MSEALTPQIHPTAIVSRGAELAAGVVIGPYTVIGERVRIGENSVVGPSCLLEGPTTIGRDNRIYGHAAIGTDPQDLKFQGEETFLEIGDANRIREFVTINRGTGAATSYTRIGSRNLLMTGVHVAHDCRVGDDAILANAATLAGHVLVGDRATVGAFSGIHQFCRVGMHAFIGGYSVITQDALPFMKTVGARGEARSYGPNTIGLERLGFSSERQRALKEAFRTLFHRGLKLKEAIEQIRASDALTPDVEELVRFVESSERGVIR